MNRGNFILIIMLSFLSLTVVAQGSKKSKTQLEKERQENLKKIEETNRILQETKTQKEATLGQLNALKNQISAREALINNLSGELDIIEAEITETEEIIMAMNRDLSSLKDEYARMVYAAYKFSNGQDQLLFMLAAENFNQFVMRVKYFKDYSSIRQKQLLKIDKVKKTLEKQKEELIAKKEEKNNLIHNKTEETQKLTTIKSSKDNIVQELSQKEKQLKKELEDRKKANDKLQKLIMDMIAAERKKAKDLAAKAAAGKNTAGANKANSSSNNSAAVKKDPELTPDTKILSGSFEANKGKLPWPVSHGNVSQHFGKQPHPVLQGVYVDNLGVDILTLKGEQVKAVFKGKVISVSEVPGMNYVVMIQHGDYFTVYAKLKKVYVAPGQEVVAKQGIGEAHTDKDDTSEIQFHVWKNDLRMNPEDWLLRK